MCSSSLFTSSQVERSQFAIVEPVSWSTVVYFSTASLCSLAFFGNVSEMPTGHSFSHTCNDRQLTLMLMELSLAAADKAFSGNYFPIYK